MMYMVLRSSAGKSSSSDILFGLSLSCVANTVSESTSGTGVCGCDGVGDGGRSGETDRLRLRSVGIMINGWAPDLRWPEIAKSANVGCRFVGKARAAKIVCFGLQQ